MDYNLKKEENIQKKKVRVFVEEIEVNSRISNFIIGTLEERYELDLEYIGNPREELKTKIKIYEVLGS